MDVETGNPGRRGARPIKVSALVLTRDATRRLPRLLKELAGVANEVVVGVDSSAPIHTWEVARSSADRADRD